MKSKKNVEDFVRGRHFRLAAVIGIVLGLVFLATGIFAQMYQEIHSNPEGDTDGVLPLPSYSITTYPYQKYAGPLVAIGCVLSVAGLRVLRENETKENRIKAISVCCSLQWLSIYYFRFSKSQALFLADNSNYDEELLKSL